ncbi:hypothetical protein E2C01_048352 [Portunus trituberculatus]|uniref:Uncharacterized protein n=1 Tax=Portunus trituberculatus TaxID=210409 RepID=A0A5B7GAR9_PORTR|nr:hypothetical protein [Portunus trituberculatus]
MGDESRRSSRISEDFNPAWVTAALTANAAQREASAHTLTKLYQRLEDPQPLCQHVRSIGGLFNWRTRWYLFPLAGVMKRLGHATSTIDYLKMDIGGSEWQLERSVTGGDPVTLVVSSPLTPSAVTVSLPLICQTCVAHLSSEFPVLWGEVG